MRVTLAWATLRRHPIRTTLAILGVAVSTAMLLDMVMLASGMQVSFRALLVKQGFGIRVTPKGTLPFDTEARIARAADAESTLRAMRAIAEVSPVLGTTLHVVRGDDATATFALGLRASVQGDYELSEGNDAVAPDAMVANDAFLRRTGARLGDTLVVASGYDAQLRSWVSRQPLRLTGRATFHYLAADQPAMSLPYTTLQALGGSATHDQVSLFMLKVTPDSDVARARADVERLIPRVTAIATADAIKSVEQRLSYFQQLSVILGSVSLIVGFLLVVTLVSVSVQERLGEIAVMRAIGISRPHIVEQVMVEGLAISVAGASLGLLLGLATAQYLNAILRAFPGLPAAIDFFVFEPRDAWESLAMLIVTTVCAGAIPSWRAASLPIATTLRTEAVS